MELINLLEHANFSESILQQEFAKDVQLGLSSLSKFLLSKYLYDDTGSHLFKQITELDEYYLTRTEQAIIHKMKHPLTDIIDNSELDIIELGVGDGHKTSLIIEAFCDKGCDINYYPIDISSAAFDLLTDNVPALDKCHTTGIVADYQRGLQYTKSISSRQKLVLFLGSNIGNFNPNQAIEFLIGIRNDLNPGDYLLIGFDLKKDIDRLIKAYDDSQGITKAFNLNLLTRINRELGGEFDLDSFQHLALYNPGLSAMESHLLSKKQQQVAIKALNMVVAFDYFEPIHLEFSFKFNTKDIQQMADKTGYTMKHHFSDDNGYFIDSLWQVTDKTL